MVSCGGGDDGSSEGRSIITGKYEDGTYCADVTYHNPNSGTTNRYTLNVEVEDNNLTKIYWGNGGWLDESHFSPEELDSQGYCSFTSDKGYEYNVQINGSECSTTDNPGGSSDDQEEETDSDEEDKKETCIRCDNEVYNYRMYCKKCIDEDENTCSKCGGFEYYVYRGKCSSCKRREREEEDEERRREEEEEERRKEENN